MIEIINPEKIKGFYRNDGFNPTRSKKEVEKKRKKEREEMKEILKTKINQVGGYRIEYNELCNMFADKETTFSCLVDKHILKYEEFIHKWKISISRTGNFIPLKPLYNA